MCIGSLAPKLQTPPNVLRTLINPGTLIGDKFGIPDPLLDAVAPKPQTLPALPAPPAPTAPAPVPQNVVSTVDRSRLRRRASLAGGPGQNRTLLSGSLVSAPGTGSSILG